MTKEETKRRAEIMLAAEYEGDTCVNIERKLSDSSVWDKVSRPYWNWRSHDYRVVSEPRVIYVEVLGDGDSLSEENLDDLKPFDDDTIGVLKITIVDGKPTAEFIDMESLK